MFWSFDPPEILDSSQLAQLPQNVYTPEDLDHLRRVDQLRSNFARLLSREAVKSYQHSQLNPMQFNDQLQAYLKTNVDTMRILILRAKMHPKYQYKLFISRNTPKYLTEDTTTNEEAAGIEIIMARYMLALGFNNCLWPIIHRTRAFMLSQPDQVNPQELDIGLHILSQGYLPLMRLCNVMDDLLKFLAQKQQKLIPEVKMAVIFSVKLILECNMNFLYIEKLRLQKQFDLIAKVARSSYTKLVNASIRLDTQREEIQQEVLYYLFSAQKYFKFYGMWAILMMNEKDILLERYKLKGYKVLTSENSKIANDLVSKMQSILQDKLATEYDKFTAQFVQVCIAPTLQKSLTIYQQNAHIGSSSPEDLFSGLTELHDYTDVLKQQGLI